MNLLELEPLIERAISEDIGKGDLTTTLCLSQKLIIEAQIIAQEEGIIAGLEVAELVFKKVGEGGKGGEGDEWVEFEEKVNDGTRVKKDDVVASISGDARSILSAERVALNFLQRLSGIASITAKFVEAVKPYPAKIYDTRKTTPGLRLLEKYAVKMGGGTNHRFGLYDGILIKDNHIKVTGGITQAVRQVQEGLSAGENMPPGLKVEVETTDLDEVNEAVNLNVDIIMLDNMSLEMIKEAVKIIRAGKKSILIEISGGVNLENVPQLAAAGVDIISIGALTHSPNALDLSLEIK
ncbi:MAG: carboxylating nicotinate-nucleotide diphosphorylase [bacterium]|nr:carboxylating nicotinate-nucleotide diphosphorylase [bacterium]